MKMNLIIQHTTDLLHMINSQGLKRNVKKLIMLLPDEFNKCTGF